MKKISLILLLLLISAPAFSFGSKPNVYEGQGYVGTLPDLSKNFKADEPSTAPPVFEQVRNFHSSSDLKPAPSQNPAFVNIILKKDKTSPYINDLREFLPMLESVYSSIEKREDVQKFASRVYFLNTNVDYFRDKYLDKPEESYISFQKLMDVALYAKSVSQLRVEAVKLTPYLAYGGAGKIYNNTNIQEQLDYLLIEVEQTINIIREAN